jgi:hypothetical protein
MRYRSKTMATWLAVGLGTLGAHRFYLKGRHDLLAWLHPLPTLAGLAGRRAHAEPGAGRRLGVAAEPAAGRDDFGGDAVGHRLWPDARRSLAGFGHNPGQPARATGWGPVLGVILALMLGGGVLMGTIAYSIQHFFEWQLQAAVHVDSGGTPSRACRLSS